MSGASQGLLARLLATVGLRRPGAGRIFQPEALRHDLTAGITVSLVAIPQSLAYAQLAGVPPYYGLYAALLPSVIGALFGSSAQLSTGPVAMTSLLTAASIAPLALRGTDPYIAYVVLLALISGVLQLAFGLMRLGVILNFLSHPVLMGFINAAAIIIGLSQLPTLLGMSSRQSEHFLLDIWQVVSNLDLVHELSLAFGLSAIAMLVAFRRWAPRLPGVLITVALLTMVSQAIDYAGRGGRVVGAIPTGLPHLGIPAMQWSSIVTLLPASLVIALISFMEAMSSAKVISIRTRVPWNENHELIGQGLAKIAAAFSLTMPVSGSFSRSALNLATGARTALSSVVSAAAVLLTLLFLTPLLYHLPKPVLAAVIMMAVVGLINVGALRRAWSVSRDDGLAAAVTFAATLLFAPNIQNGIATGIALSMGLLLYRMMRPRVAILGMHPDGTLRDAGAHKLAPLHPRLSAVRFDGALRFMNASFFEDAILKVEQDNPDATCILLTCGGINQIDASGVEMLMLLVDRFRANGLTLVFSGLKMQVRDVMDRTGLTSHIGAANIFASDQQAVEALLRRLAEAERAPGPDLEAVRP
jgi:SulP family sulfate permease